MFCYDLFLIERWGEVWCDTECGPFGGTWDTSMGEDNAFCNWSTDDDPMGACPQEWRLEKWAGEMSYQECDTECLGTGGHYEWSYEYEMDDCVWDNVH